MPVFDFEKVNSSDEKRKLLQIQGVNENRLTRKNSKEQIDPFNMELNKIEKRITKGLSINVVCDYCEGPIYGKPRILKFADIERFFCCISCKSGYKEKYRGRIESIKRKYEGKSDIDA
jgi:Lrp/AsnC family leucine-responsive transcriptional regulator